MCRNFIYLVNFCIFKNTQFLCSICKVYQNWAVLPQRRLVAMNWLVEVVNSALSLLVRKAQFKCFLNIDETCIGKSNSSCVPQVAIPSQRQKWIHSQGSLVPCDSVKEL